MEPPPGTHPETLRLKQVRFEISFAIGQIGAQTIINAHSKSPEVRLRAKEAMTDRIAQAFERLTVVRYVSDYTGPLCGWAKKGGGNL